MTKYICEIRASTLFYHKKIPDTIFNTFP